MAKAISNVPLLTGEAAERFVNEAEYNAKHLAGSKYDAEAQTRAMNIIERSRRFQQRMRRNDA